MGNKGLSIGPHKRNALLLGNLRRSYGKMQNSCRKSKFSQRKFQKEKTPALSHLTTKDKLGYAEEYITLESKDQKECKLFKYSLSNNLEDIKIAAYIKTGHNISIETSNWKINKNLSLNVKYLMNKHRVTFSMTTWEEGKNKFLVVNMRISDIWFKTSFVEYQKEFVDTECLKVIKRTVDYINRIQSQTEYD